MQTLLESIDIAKKHYLEMRADENNTLQADIINNVGAGGDYLKSQTNALPLKKYLTTFITHEKQTVRTSRDYYRLFV